MTQRISMRFYPRPDFLPYLLTRGKAGDLMRQLRQFVADRMGWEIYDVDVAIIQVVHGVNLPALLVEVNCDGEDLKPTANFLAELSKKLAVEVLGYEWLPQRILGTVGVRISTPVGAAYHLALRDVKS